MSPTSPSSLSHVVRLLRTALVGAAVCSAAACASSVSNTGDGGADSGAPSDVVLTADTSVVMDAVTSTDAVAPSDTVMPPVDVTPPTDVPCTPGRTISAFEIRAGHCVAAGARRPVPAPDAGSPDVGSPDVVTADGGSAEPPDVDTATCELNCAAACGPAGTGGAGDIAPGSDCRRTSATTGECIFNRVCR